MHRRLRRRADGGCGPPEQMSGLTSARPWWLGMRANLHGPDRGLDSAAAFPSLLSSRQNYSTGHPCGARWSWKSVGMGRRLLVTLVQTAWLVRRSGAPIFHLGRSRRMAPPALTGAAARGRSQARCGVIQGSGDTDGLWFLIAVTEASMTSRFRTRTVIPLTCSMWQ